MIERTAVTQRESRTRYRVGRDALAELRRHLEPLPDRVAILTDPNVWETYGGRVERALAPAQVVVLNVAGEADKVLDVAARLLAELATNRIHRRETLVVLGGGVCCDVGGLVAMLYMRGMRYVIVATTLMAQLDAAIGGKVGCNGETRKNLLGGFHHADLVLIDPTFLQTLPERHLRAALAEAVKLDVLLPELGIAAVLEDSLEEPELIRLAELCLDGKLKLLTADPFETDLRRSLNLGHAVAHALEGMPGTELLHGEAVSIGLAATARYAEAKAICSAAHAREIVSRLERLGLPIAASRDSSLLSERLAQIADHRGGRINLVVPSGEAGVEIRSDCDFGLLADCVQGLPVTH
jgi:3-dehydroquinate synthase